MGRLFSESEQIVVATDAGREGELIFRYLYSYLNCRTPFVRLWISSLTDKAIREGLRHLEEGSRYDRLYHAAKARSEADWLVGINATQAMTIAAGRGTYSLGRVQTPTLAMVCARYWEHKRFTPEAFWHGEVNQVPEGPGDGIAVAGKITFFSLARAHDAGYLTCHGGLLCDNRLHTDLLFSVFTYCFYSHVWDNCGFSGGTQAHTFMPLLLRFSCFC